MGTSIKLTATATEIISAAISVAPRDAAFPASGHAMEPAVDANGRLHAPCDGYEWEGVIYRGGEYLGETSCGPTVRRIKAKADAAEIIARELGGSTGKEFYGQKIAYVPLTDAQWKAVQAVLPVEKAMVLADDDVPNAGKPFKFSMKAWMAQRVRQNDFYSAWLPGIGDDKHGKMVRYAYGCVIA